MNMLMRLNHAFIAYTSHIPQSLLLLGGRLAIAAIFYLSARTKIDGFMIKDSTYFLFEHEYALPLISPVIAAILATLAEHIFSALLAIGFATRLSALGLLGMTLTIQIFVYPGAWATHGIWAVSLIMLLKYGGGTLSIDHLLSKRFMKA
ncbi:MAG: DoxX family protein [Alphaproteobacteria bacterium]